MKKKFIIIIAAVIVVLAGLLITLFSNLGSLIKTAINTYGPEITKTEVRVADVSLSLFSARAEIKGFYLGNPGAFKSNKAFAVESIYMDVDEKSLASDPIIIEKIEVVAPEITYEKLGKTDNFKTILNNIKKAGETEKNKKSDPDKKGEAKKIIIRDLVIRDGNITLVTPLLAGKEITTALPDIHLKGIGEQKGGLAPAAVANEIIAVLYENVMSPGITKALDEQIQKLGGVLGETQKEVTKQTSAVVKDAEKTVEALGDRMKGIFGE